MTTKTAGEKLYEVENLMKTAVGLNQQLGLDDVDALMVEMKLLPFEMGDGRVALKVSCDNLEFSVDGVTLDEVVDKAMAVANRAVGEAAEEVRSRPKQPYAGLRLVHSA